MAFINNLAPFVAYSDGVIVQTSAPYVRLPGNGFNVGYPTIPNLARGSVVSTTLNEMNNNISHMCDFVLEMQKNNALRRFINATLQSIRTAIRAVLASLGADPTGIVSWAVQTLKSITRFLQYVQTEIIQPILDFEYLIIGYVRQLRLIIQFIQNLPARLLALLQNCLTQLFILIANIFSDIVGSVTDAGFIAAAKEAYATAQQTYAAANQAVNVLPAQIKTETSQLVTSATQATSQSQLDSFKQGIPNAISSAAKYVTSTQISRNTQAP
jgi:hypothetical protein